MTWAAWWQGWLLEKLLYAVAGYLGGSSLQEPPQSGSSLVFHQATAVSQIPKWQGVLGWLWSRLVLCKNRAGSPIRVCRGPAALLAALQHSSMPVGTAQHAARRLAVACGTALLSSRPLRCELE